MAMEQSAVPQGIKQHRLWSPMRMETADSFWILLISTISITVIVTRVSLELSDYPQIVDDRRNLYRQSIAGVPIRSRQPAPGAHGVRPGWRLLQEQLTIRPYPPRYPHRYTASRVPMRWYLCR